VRGGVNLSMADISLSPQALQELKDILIKDIGKESVEQLSDADIHEFGELLLTLAKQELKRNLTS